MRGIYLRPRDAVQALKLHNQIRAELELLLRDVDSPYPFQDRRDHGLGGKIKFADAWILQAILATYKPTTILEIGSFLGFSTRWFLEITAREDNVARPEYQAPHLRRTAARLATAERTFLTGWR